MLSRGSLDERTCKSCVSRAPPRDLALVGDQERPIDWDRVLREMRAAGVTASRDVLDEHDLRALWERAQGRRTRRSAGPRRLCRCGAARGRASGRERVLEKASGQLVFHPAA